MIVVKIVMSLVIAGMRHVMDAVTEIMERIPAWFFKVYQAVQIWS
jgi:hypothetical protein